MKYKLINLKTKKETICSLVTIDGFEYYVSNIKADKIDQWVVDMEYSGRPLIYKTDKEFFEIGKEEFLCVATNNLNIDIPKVIDVISYLALENTNSKEENYIKNWNTDQFIDYSLPIFLKDKEILHKDKLKLVIRLNRSGDSMRGFKNGYNKAKEQYQYSEEDMINFMDFESEWLKHNKYRNASMDYKPYGNGETISRKQLLSIWKDQQIKALYYEE